MNTPETYITVEDHRLLSTLLDRAIASSDPCMRTDLGRLCLDLRSARIVPSNEVPRDVVTLNSRVVIRDLASAEEEVWVLVLPHEASLDQHKLSVLSPLGAALLGAREGETVQWSARQRSGRARIRRLVFQPEAMAVAPALPSVP